jgi:hypothetical protein
MKSKLFALICFGIAFAFVEAVVVVYLRNTAVYDLLAVKPGYKQILNLGFIAFIPLSAIRFTEGKFLNIEILREAATIIMLLSVALLSAKRLVQRLGVFLIAFSLWDLFYYVFLKFLINWPKGLFDIDIFFLIPVAWIGPVITPVVISIVLLVTGVIMMTL